MKWILYFLSVSFCFGDSLATVEFVEGKAVVERYLETIVVKEKMELQPGDVLQVNSNARVTLLIPSVGTVKLQEESRFKIPFSETKKVSKLQLYFGSIFSSVKKMIAGESFEIKTPTASAGVRGTKFEVAYDPRSGETMTLVDEGAVESRNHKGRTALLRRGMVSRISRQDFTSYRDESLVSSRMKKFEAIPDDGSLKSKLKSRQRLLFREKYENEIQKREDTGSTQNNELQKQGLPAIRGFAPQTGVMQNQETRNSFQGLPSSQSQEILNKNLPVSLEGRFLPQSLDKELQNPSMHNKLIPGTPRFDSTVDFQKMSQTAIQQHQNQPGISGRQNLNPFRPTTPERVGTTNWEDKVRENQVRSVQSDVLDPRRMAPVTIPGTQADITKDYIQQRQAMNVELIESQKQNPQGIAPQKITPMQFPDHRQSNYLQPDFQSEIKPVSTNFTGTRIQNQTNSKIDLKATEQVRTPMPGNSFETNLQQRTLDNRLSDPSSIKANLSQQITDRRITQPILSPTNQPQGNLTVQNTQGSLLTNPNLIPQVITPLATTSTETKMDSQISATNAQQFPAVSSNTATKAYQKITGASRIAQQNIQNTEATKKIRQIKNQSSRK